MMVVDEAHRSTGKYAYATTVAAVLAANPHVRIIGLSATPGKDVNQVQKVVNALRIDKIERRADTDEGLRAYHHDKLEEPVRCDLTAASEIRRVRDLMVAKIKQVVAFLRQTHNLSIGIQADRLTSYNVRTQIQQLGSMGGVSEKDVKSVLYKLQALAHERQMLEDYGVEALCGGAGMRAEAADDDSDEDGAKKKKAGGGSSSSGGFNSLEELMRYVGGPDPAADAQALRAAPHPKALRLRELLLDHFQRKAHAQQAARTKVIIFSASRAAVESLVTFLGNETRTFADMHCEDAGCGQTGRVLRPHAFVGQAASKTSKGLKQSEQRRVIEDLKAGRFNILVATSIAEEGLDIGEVRTGGEEEQTESAMRWIDVDSQLILPTTLHRAGRPVRALRRGDLLAPQDAAQRAHGPPPPRPRRPAVPAGGREEDEAGQRAGEEDLEGHGPRAGPRQRRGLGEEQEDAGAGGGEPADAPQWAAPAAPGAALGPLRAVQPREGQSVVSETLIARPWLCSCRPNQL